MKAGKWRSQLISASATGGGGLDVRSHARLHRHQRQLPELNPALSLQLRRTPLLAEREGTGFGSRAEAGVSGAPLADAAAAREAPRREKVREWHERLRDPSLTALLIIRIVAIFIAAPAAAIGVPLPRVASLSLVLESREPSRDRITRAEDDLHRPRLHGHEHHRGGSARAPPGSSDSHPKRAGNCARALRADLGNFNRRFRARPRHRSSNSGRDRALPRYRNYLAALFRLVDEISPNSFTGLPPIGTGAHFKSALIYFSFTTLTSIGFGDVVPVHPFARSLANLEGIVGQLYPATLLARIVTLHLESGRR